MWSVSGAGSPGTRAKDKGVRSIQNLIGRLCLSISRPLRFHAKLIAAQG